MRHAGDFSFIQLSNTRFLEKSRVSAFFMPEGMGRILETVWNVKILGICKIFTDSA